MEVSSLLHGIGSTGLPFPASYRTGLSTLLFLREKCRCDNTNYAAEFSEIIEIRTSGELILEKKKTTFVIMVTPLPHYYKMYAFNMSIKILEAIYKIKMFLNNYL